MLKLFLPMVLIPFAGYVFNVLQLLDWILEYSKVLLQLVYVFPSPPDLEQQNIAPYWRR